MGSIGFCLKQVLAVVLSASLLSATVPSPGTNGASPVQSGRAPTSDNQRLLSELNAELDAGDDLIGKEAASLNAALLAKGISQLAPGGSDVSEMIKSASTFKKFSTAVDSFTDEEYLSALSSLIKAGAGFAGGPAGWAAYGEDTGERIFRLWLMGLDQAQLAEAAWNLQEANNYAHFKDPETQAALKQMYDSLYGDVAAWDHAFKAALAKNHRTPESIAKDLAAESNRKVAAKALKGLTIVEPDESVQALRNQACINPDFIRALEIQNQALAVGDVATAAAADKYPDRSYIPIFTTNCKPNSRATAKVVSSPVPVESAKSTPRPGVTIDFERLNGRTGVSIEGAGGRVLDSAEQNTYGMIGTGIGFGIKGLVKNLNPGNYVFDFYEAGFGRVPIEIRKNYVTVISASPAQLRLSVEFQQRGLMDLGARACLADANQKSLITTGAGVAQAICSFASGPSQVWLVAPGTYDVVTLDGLGGNRLRSGYSPIHITLEPGQKFEITTHPDKQ